MVEMIMYGSKETRSSDQLKRQLSVLVKQTADAADADVVDADATE